MRLQALVFLVFYLFCPKTIAFSPLKNAGIFTGRTKFAIDSICEKAYRNVLRQIALDVKGGHRDAPNVFMEPWPDGKYQDTLALNFEAKQNGYHVMLFFRCQEVKEDKIKFILTLSKTWRGRFNKLKAQIIKRDQEEPASLDLVKKFIRIIIRQGAYARKCAGEPCYELDTRLQKRAANLATVFPPPENKRRLTIIVIDEKKVSRPPAKNFFASETSDAWTKSPVKKNLRSKKSGEKIFSFSLGLNFGLLLDPFIADKFFSPLGIVELSLNLWHFSFSIKGGIGGLPDTPAANHFLFAAALVFEPPALSSDYFFLGVVLGYKYWVKGYHDERSMSGTENLLGFGLRIRWKINRHLFFQAEYNLHAGLRFYNNEKKFVFGPMSLDLGLGLNFP